MSHKLTVTDATAASRIINMMSVNIPKSMAVRELVVNGIEACLRNPDEPGEVRVMRDHVHTNKLMVVNTGGDYLSEKIFKENLCNLGSSGNLNPNGDLYLDENKGIGVKVAYLGKARNGLVYRSVKSGDDIGTMTQMCQNIDNGIYELPSVFCEYLQDKTSWPNTGRFSSWLGGCDLDPEDDLYYRLDSTLTGTEVVCMGDHHSDNTWAEFDNLCGSRKGSSDGGTGYGLYKNLTHRFWTEPQVPVYVEKCEKETGENWGWMKVHGLMSFMKGEGCKLNGTIDLTYGDDNLPVKAHWSVMKKAGESGYNSNRSSMGYTTIAWKGETYTDFDQHYNSVKKEMSDCGVIIGWQHVLIVFEFDDSIDLKTNPGRTNVVFKETRIDKNLLHELFRQNLPEDLRDWIQSNQVDKIESGELEKTLRADIKSMGFGFNKKKVDDDQGKKEKDLHLATPRDSDDDKPKKERVRSKNPKVQARINARAGLRNCRVPKITVIDEQEEEYINFNADHYTIILNIGSALYQKRRSRVLDILNEPCLVFNSLDFELKRQIIASTLYTIFETSTYSEDLSWEEKKEKWRPEVLESNWNRHNEGGVLKQIRAEQRKEKKLAS